MSDGSARWLLFLCSPLANCPIVRFARLKKCFIWSRVNRDPFGSNGFHEDFAMQNLTVGEVNSCLRRDLVKHYCRNPREVPMYRMLVLLVLLSFPALIWAQVAGSGSIEGTVVDPSGAAVAGATVTATNVATGVQTVRQTTNAGFFAISPLPPGQYRITVSASGFKTLTQESVTLEALATVGLNLKLELGMASQSITVESAPSMLKTDDATLGASMQNEVYDALPLAMNGVPRDPTQFVALVPGVNSYTTQVAGPSFGSFNGGQTYQNEVYVEGIPLTNAGTEA